MRRTLLLAFASSLVALSVGLLPASAITPAGFDCGPDDGRERLTTDGLTLNFEAPAVAAPELAATHDATGDVVTPHRSAHFDLRADFTPYASGDLAFEVTWVDSSDFDLYVFDGEGNQLAVSNASNIDEGDTKVEAATAEGIAHCSDLSVEVRNWAGRPDQMLRLKIEFKNPGPAFACEEDDPHAACAGKLEGEAPSRLPDTRTSLYLGGDRPGQLAMQGHYPFDTADAGEPPLRATLSKNRPLGGKSNSFSKTAAGNPEQYANPFMANFDFAVSGPTAIKGDATAVLWVSSQTLPDGGGPLFVDLWADGSYPTGTKLARVQVPGTALGKNPTRIVARFTGLDATIESELLLQVSSLPVVSTGGTTPPTPSVGNPADAEWTIYYDSVQFPSRLTLDLPAPA